MNASGSLRSRLHQGLVIEDPPSERIDPRALKVWRINGFINATVYLLIAVGFLFFTTTVIAEIPDWVGWLVLAVAVIYLPLAVLLVPLLRMRYWRYEIREHEIDIQHGIIIIRRNLIPMVRVQHVDTEHGPILRHYGLATLKVSTAASNFYIPALSKEKANELRGEISTLARVSDEDV
ncbi:MAG: PH domain-containing protein [Candidatus Methanomethylophilaceae archaeon]|jgi:membrane protein YdbS with pleckstrin-like domain